MVPIGCLVVSTWLARWHVILTGSMAPALLGAHCDVTCHDCGFRYAMDAERPPQYGQRVVCPNCGYAEELKAATEHPGNRVLVARSIYSLRPPERWEMVTCRLPDRPGAFGVKRVVGLPGERILLRGGDVYIDGYLARKTLAQQQAMAILVHDADYPPGKTSNAKPRWRKDSNYTGWKREGQAFVYHPIHSLADWLMYHHEHRQAAPPHRVVEAPVDDRYGYNQTLPIRDLHPMRDLMLTFRVRHSSDATWVVRATDPPTVFDATFRASDEQLILYRDGKEILKRTIPLGEGEHTLVVSLFDRRYEIALDGRSLYQMDLDTSDLTTEPSSEPFAIGPLSGFVEVRELRVWRDVYYTHPPQLTTPRNRSTARALFQPYTLGPDEFFVLGDNSPRSLDSRYAAFGPAIPRSLLVGSPCWKIKSN
jgi:signal peptidase I